MAAMIHLRVCDLFLLPLVFNLVALLLGGLYYAARSRRMEASPARPRIYRCSVCGHVYVDERDVPLARCARCGTMNEAVKR
mgnify:CR=1 FL=1